MANSIKAQVKQDFQQLKAQGGNRISRIREIIQEAAAQTIAEVKQGSGDIQGIAKGTFSTVAETLTEDKTQSDPESKNSSATLKQLAARTFAAVKPKLSGQIQHQATKLDAELTERYGSRYQGSKQRIGEGLDQATEHYRQAIATAKAQGTVPLQQKQAEIQEKAGLFGAAIARKEQQVKQYVKSILKTSTTKR
jgi:hypothetical protein